MTVGRTPIKVGGAALLAGGLALAVFPLIRPFGAFEAQMPGPEVLPGADITAIAAQLSSPSWVISHLIATFGFFFLLVGFVAIFLELMGSRAERLAFTALVLCLFGAAMLGAVAALEGVGLRTVAVLQQQGKGDVIAGVVLLRFGPSVVLFGPGLLLLAAGAVINTVAMSRSDSFSKWASVAFCVGLVFFLPLLPRVIRVADGLFTGAGAAGLSLDLWRKRAS
jgi:hypothetical protein